MFYADFVLSKKGPLSKVWLAAHWEKKLSKAQIVETDVNEAVSEIMQPQQKLALRTTGHLLLGICRVFSRQTKYLLADCNEAFLKIKLVFTKGALDQPNPTFPTFTIQDIYGEFGDNVLPEFDDDELNHAPICQSRIDDITMKEDIPLSTTYDYTAILEDDDFGEIAAGVAPEDFTRMLEDVNKEFDAQEEVNSKGALFGRHRESTPALGEAHAPGNTIFGEDDIGGSYDDDRMDEEDHNFQSTSDYQHDNHMPIEEMDYGDDHYMRSEVPLGEEDNYRDETPLRSETPARSETPRAQSPTPSVAPSIAPSTSQVLEQDTVESFYEKHAQKRAQAKEQTMKKRKLDDVRMITGEEMKANMADYRELLVHLDLTPPTRKLMWAKRKSHADFLMHFPAMIGFTRCKQYIRAYQENLTVTKLPDNDQKVEAIKNALQLWEIGEEDLQQQQQEMEMQVQDDPIYNDDFDDVAPIDYDNFDMCDIPQAFEPQQDISDDESIPQRNPLSPFTCNTDDEDGSPSEKKRKFADDKDDMDESGIDEDNRWSKRTQLLLTTIAGKLDQNDGQIELDEMLKKGTSRKTAAAKFYSILCLKKNQCIDIEQKESYGDIVITAGPNIDVSLI
ncbi:hypothetical protein B9Z55_024783 [Caenorhabditis nigoni]|uniref:Rad21/Rec8-like protein N-terminal domain-containing protein n=1 Tax=Caenorhabditis nigoni TaxID=1611254 RepID=A0A2G5SW17_9PELO|nr:hypothetical protein B9Z55_024783 [Caenorhabditis nigoni]